ncbi:MAG: hypothetical protein JHD35_11275 [Sphingopyxis sp.]|nr:hypothetical protein [Sphingopyxis sp.]
MLRTKIALALGIAATTSVGLLAHGDDIFLGPNVWTDPAPATYQLQFRGTNLCLGRSGPRLRTQQPFLVVERCNPDVLGQNLEFAPHKAAAPAFTLTSPVRWRVTTMGSCATFARNVVFGAPAVDMLHCDVPPAGTNPALTGGNDQSWILKAAGGDAVRIANADDRCWTAQNSSIAEGTQMVMEQCNGGAAQTFVLKRQSGLFEGTEAARAFGWMPINFVPDGFNNSIPDRFRTLRNLDLAGRDYAPETIATPNDQGAACAARCARDNRCRAFTWVDPRLGGGQARCFVKDGIPEPASNPLTMSGIVRPR